MAYDIGNGKVLEVLVGTINDGALGIPLTHSEFLDCKPHERQIATNLLPRDGFEDYSLMATLPWGMGKQGIVQAPLYVHLKPSRNNIPISMRESMGAVLLIPEKGGVTTDDGAKRRGLVVMLEGFPYSINQTQAALVDKLGYEAIDSGDQRVQLAARNYGRQFLEQAQKAEQMWEQRRMLEAIQRNQWKGPRADTQAPRPPAGSRYQGLPF